VSSLAVGVGHYIPLTAAVGEVFGLEMDVVVAIVDESEVVIVIINIYVHVLVAIHILVNLRRKLGVAVHSFDEVVTLFP